MKCIVNGLDVLPFLEEKGFQVTENDLDGENVGRAMDGIMIRDRISQKRKIEAKCRDLETWETNKLLKALAPETMMVTYTDPKYGEITIEMYATTTAAVLKEFDYDHELWEGINFHLIEV